MSLLKFILCLWIAHAVIGLCPAAVCVTASAPVVPPVVPPPPSTNDPVEVTQTTLPLEVFGPDQSTVTTTLTVASGAGDVTGLYVRAHNVVENKISVRINGGGWRTLHDNNVQMTGLELATYGMGGVTDTIRFTVPLSPGEVVNGSNEVEFRFNDVDGFSIGYTVIDLSFMKGAVRVNPIESFVFDNPAAWTPPSSNPADIAEGFNLWSNGALTDFFPFLGVRTNIVAKCADCHDHAGRDLKYFNFSNKSIRERSKFHGLTEAEGNKIASYIRSLSIPYVAAARPWNPAYQPGPGMDAKPAYEWAAGAGLGAVLETEEEMIAELFPGGINTNALNFEGAIVNVRETRHTIQLPTWFRWLPRVHPLDQSYALYSTNGYYLLYLEMYEELAGMTTATQRATYVDGKMSRWDSFSTPFVQPANTDPAYPEWAFNHFARLKWRVVKTWEFLTGYGLQDQGHELFGATKNGAPLNDRTWLHGEVFRIGPHVSKQVKIDTFFVESMQWYQLQLVLNDGLRQNPAIVPIDWGYQHALNVSAWNNPADRPFIGNLYLNIIKGNEVVANGIGTSSSQGWDMSKGDVYRIAPDENGAQYAMIDVATRRAVAEAILEQWLFHCMKYTRAQYAARPNFKFTTQRRGTLIEMAENCATIGVSDRHVNMICDFGALLYPDFDWNPYRP